MMDLRGSPGCRKRTAGTMNLLSDSGRDGAPILYKAWVCTIPTCGFTLRIDHGAISMGRAIGASSR